MFMVPVWSPFSHQGGYHASLPPPSRGQVSERGGGIIVPKRLKKRSDVKVTVNEIG